MMGQYGDGRRGRAPGGIGFHIWMWSDTASQQLMPMIESSSKQAVGDLPGFEGFPRKLFSFSDNAIVKVRSGSYRKSAPRSIAISRGRG